MPNIRQLSVTLRVKPTTARDALLQAQVMGLVRFVPRSGAYLRSLTYAPLVAALSGTIEPALMQADHNLFHLLDVSTRRRGLRSMRPVRVLPHLEASSRPGATMRRFSTKEFIAGMMARRE